jgi:hypothetical protein
VAVTLALVLAVGFVQAGPPAAWRAASPGAAGSAADVTVDPDGTSAGGPAIDAQALPEFGSGPTAITHGSGASRTAAAASAAPVVVAAGTPQAHPAATAGPPSNVGYGGTGPQPGLHSPPAAMMTPVTAGVLCPIFPPSNVWNKDISGLSVASNSTAMVNAIGRNSSLHPDFDTVGDGIPYNVVAPGTPTYTVHFDYADESDPGPYPIPASPLIEGGSDRHMLMLDKAGCRLYELYDVRKSGSTWYAGSGAIWNLRSNALRPAGWTSADAAGLPILPGLVRWDELQSGVIKHAIRFTASSTCGYIYPARHLTAPACPSLPPMGLRVRLKASVNISGFGPQSRVVLTALKHYGMILADNGSPWYITGEPSSHWDDDDLHGLGNLTGADFEVVDTSGLVNG